MVKAVIYDLDDTLYPVSSLNREVFRAFIEHFKRSALPFLTESAVLKACEELWTAPIGQVFDRYNFPDQFIEEVRENAKAIKIEPGDLRGVVGIELIPEISSINFLVTSGLKHLQWSKIKALNIQSFFKEVRIDEPARNNGGKKVIFQEILEQYELEPYHVMVVGDNLQSELLAGFHLGMRTTQLLHPDKPKCSWVDYHIRDLCGLKKILVA